MVDAASVQILAFTAAAAVLTVTPGLDTVVVLRSSTAEGPRAGAAAALGICGGLLAWGAGAAFGLTALLSASAVAFDALKWGGAAYLVVLGAKLLVRPRAGLPAPSGTWRREGVADALKRGFLTNVLNPKVGVFYLTFLPQVMPDGANVAAFSLLLAGVHVLLSLAWFALLIALTVPFGRLLARPRVTKLLDRLAGCVFVAFGARLAVARRA